MTLNRHRQAKTLLEQAGFPRFQGFWMTLAFFLATSDSLDLVILLLYPVTFFQRLGGHHKDK